MQLLGDKKGCSANVYSDTKQMSAGKFVKSERLLAVLRKDIILNVK